MAHDITESNKNKVKAMKAVGATNEVIAIALGVTRRTLEKHYKQEIALGKEEIDAAIGTKLVQMCLKGDRTAIFFYLKTRCGWRETQEIEHTNLPKLEVEVIKPKKKG